MHFQQIYHIVVIGYVWPEPNSSAAGQNMVGILTSLVNAGAKVTFLTPSNESIHSIPLTELGIPYANTPLNDDNFDQHINELQPDVVIFDRFFIEEQFSWRVKQQLPNCLLVLNTEDLHSLRSTREQAIKKSNEVVVDRLTHNDKSYREIASILRCDLTLIVSAYEFQLLKQNSSVPSAQLCYLPIFLSQPAASISQQLPNFAQRNGFCFIGNYRHAPNWDALLQLKNEIWPRIKHTYKEAEISIYGAYPSKKVTDLHNVKQGFLVKGWVEDAHSAIAQSRVLLAPLRFGAGVKGKLVNAMQVNTPSVTTVHACEGICASQQWPGILTNDWNEFASAAVQLHNNESAWQSCQPNMGAILNTTFNNKRNAKTLITRLQILLNDPVNHRNKLFLRKMVWHHSLTSAQYMSQWIAEKSKHKTSANGDLL